MGNEGGIEADSFGGNKSTYLGIEIGKVADSDFDGLISDPDN